VSFAFFFCFYENLYLLQILEAHTNDSLDLSGIVECFTNRVSWEIEAHENLPDTPTQEPDMIHLNDKIELLWGRDPDFQPDDIPLDPETLVEDLTEPTAVLEDTKISQLLGYQDFIVKSPAYKWLLATLQKEFLLLPANPDVMEGIRSKIMSFLPRCSFISKKKPAETHQITFKIEWNPLAFVHEQEYTEEPEDVIETAITLTGCDKDAQALTCVEYMCQTWPTTGKYVIQLLKDVVCSGSEDRCTCKFPTAFKLPNADIKFAHTDDLPHNTKLTLWINGSTLMSIVIGTRCSVAEIGEQLAWLGAALRSSPYEVGIASCTPFISNFREENVPNSPSPSSGTAYFCDIDFTVEEMMDSSESTNGQCWHSLFRNPVVVQGYPILRRAKGAIGVEIPLSIMAALAHATRVTNFLGKTLVKGFCTMLVPVKHVGELVLWHVLSNKDGAHISYQDSRVSTALGPNPEMFIDLDFDSARHIVGWCSDVKNYAGKNCEEQ
jgi:hypothetical protein